MIPDGERHRRGVQSLQQGRTQAALGNMAMAGQNYLQSPALCCLPWADGTGDSKGFHFLLRCPARSFQLFLDIISSIDVPLHPGIEIRNLYADCVGPDTSTGQPFSNPPEHSAFAC